MKKLIATLLLALCATQASADSWTGNDKKLHLGAGLVISGLVTMHTKDRETGFYAGVVAGAAKELIDATGAGEPSVKDFAVTALGAAIGAYTGGLIVSRTQGTTTIAYTTTFK